MGNPLDLWRGRATSPWRDFNDWQNQFDRMFTDWGMPKAMATNFKFTPSCEVKEDKNSYMFKFDLPGVDKDNIKIEVDGNHLFVTAERREERKSDEEKKHFSEISYGAYARTFTLPTKIDERLVEAKYDGGVLNLRVPKGESATSKTISVR